PTRRSSDLLQLTVSFGFHTTSIGLGSPNPLSRRLWMRRREFIAGLGGMHSLCASAFLSVMLLAAPLGAGLPSRLVGQASAGEPDEVPPVESTQSRSRSATPSNSAASVARICDALAAAAAENDLPVDFF